MKQPPRFCHDPAVGDSVVVSRPFKIVIRPDEVVWVGRIDPWTFTINSGPHKWMVGGAVILFCELDKLKLIHEKIGEMLEKLEKEEVI